MFTSPDPKPPHLDKAAIRSAMDVVEAALKPGAIDHNALQNYMARTGWRSEWQQVGEKARLWKKDGPAMGWWVDVLLDRCRSDYEEMMTEAIHEISLSEGRRDQMLIRLEVMIEGADE